MGRGYREVTFKEAIGQAVTAVLRQYLPEGEEIEDYEININITKRIRPEQFQPKMMPYEE